MKPLRSQNAAASLIYVHVVAVADRTVIATANIDKVTDLILILGERYYLLRSYVGMSRSSVVCLSVCLSVMFVCLAHHLIAQGLGQFFC